MGGMPLGGSLGFGGHGVSLFLLEGLGSSMTNLAPFLISATNELDVILAKPDLIVTTAFNAPLAIDLTGSLASGETLTSISNVTIRVLEGVDGGAASHLGASGIVPNTNQVAVQFSGARAYCMYLVAFQVTSTLNGVTGSWEAGVRVICEPDATSQ